LKLREQNKSHTQETNSLSELDNLEGISSLLFGNYESSEDFDNVTNNYFTILFII
jgi:hypothetical protein